MLNVSVVVWTSVAVWMVAAFAALRGQAGTGLARMAVANHVSDASCVDDCLAAWHLGFSQICRLPCQITREEIKEELWGGLRRRCWLIHSSDINAWLKHGVAVNHDAYQRLAIQMG